MIDWKCISCSFSHNLSSSGHGFDPVSWMFQNQGGLANHPTAPPSHVVTSPSPKFPLFHHPSIVAPASEAATVPPWTPTVEPHMPETPLVPLPTTKWWAMTGQGHMTASHQGRSSVHHLTQKRLGHLKDRCLPHRLMVKLWGCLEWCIQMI